MFQDMQAIDYLSYILVGAATIGGLIAIVVSLFRNQKRKALEQKRHDSTGVLIPAELAKLPSDKFIVVRRPRFMTLLGKSTGSHIIFSVYGIFIVEYSIESGFIGGRFGNSHWHKSTAMGMGSRAFTSPMWRALIYHHTLCRAVEGIEVLPFFPMAVFPDGTHIDIHLNPYRLDEEDEEDDEDFEDEEFEESESEDALDIAAEEAWEDEDDEEEEAEDLEVTFDPTKFVGSIEDIVEFIQDNSVEEVISFEELKDLAERCKEYFEDVKYMEEPEVKKGIIPVEYLHFSRDYHNKKHLQQLVDEGVILMGNKKDLAENDEQYQAEAAAKLEASRAKNADE